MNKFKKIIISFLIVILATGCKKDKEVEKPIEKAPEIEEVEEKQTSEIKIKPGTFASKIVLDNIKNDEFDFKIDKSNNFSKIEQNDFDLAIVPGYLAPYFYNKTDGNIEVSAITSTGNLYMVSDTKLNSQMDYKGKNLYIPDITGNLSKIVENKIGSLNFVLRLKLEYFKSLDEIVEKMDDSSNYVSILADPFYTKSLRKTQYVSKVDDLLPLGEGDFISEVIIVNKDYLKNNKDDFDSFLKAYKDASDKISEETEISDDILSTYDITKEEGKKAIERRNISYVAGKSMKDIYKGFIDKLYEFDKNIFAGDTPNDDFYYKK